MKNLNGPSTQFLVLILLELGAQHPPGQSFQPRDDFVKLVCPKIGDAMGYPLGYPSNVSQCDVGKIYGKDWKSMDKVRKSMVQ